MFSHALIQRSADPFYAPLRICSPQADPPAVCHHLRRMCAGHSATSASSKPLLNKPMVVLMARTDGRHCCVACRVDHTAVCWRRQAFVRLFARSIPGAVDGNAFPCYCVLILLHPMHTGISAVFLQCSTVVVHECSRNCYRRLEF